MEEVWEVGFPSGCLVLGNSFPLSLLHKNFPDDVDNKVRPFTRREMAMPAKSPVKEAGPSDSEVPLLHLPANLKFIPYSFL